MLEVIGFNIKSCAKAQAAGADRIELCDNPAEGGTTPSYGFIKAARKVLAIDLFCMIRPRGGNFIYSDDEFEIMKTDIDICKQLGCDGVVFGMLRQDGSIDVERCEDLVELAYPMEVTFHRAFDRCNDPIKGLEEIISTGCTRILTSGQKPTAMEGIDLIASLVKKAEERITIMPGSGLRSDNIKLIVEKSGAKEFHSSSRLKDSSDVDEEEVKKMVALLK